MNVLKVASQSNPNSVSGAVAGALERDGVVELHAIGAGAVNQAVKAIAIARRHIEKQDGPCLKVTPGFMEVTINGNRKTGMRLIVEK